MKGSVRGIINYATPQVVIPAFAICAGGYYLYNSYIAGTYKYGDITESWKKVYNKFSDALSSAAQSMYKNWLNISCSVAGLAAICCNLDNATIASRIAKITAIFAPLLYNAGNSCGLFSSDDHYYCKKSATSEALQSAQAISIAGYTTALCSSTINALMPVEYRFSFYCLTLFMNYCIVAYQFYRADPWNEVKDNKNLSSSNVDHLSELAKMSLIICSVGFISHYLTITAAQRVLELDSSVVKLGLCEVASAAFALIFSAIAREALGIDVMQ